MTIEYPDTWLKAAVGVVAGGATSLVIQSGLMKLSKEVAKKVTPGVALAFSILGFAQSVRLTIKLVTEELPQDEAEEYVSSMIAGTILMSLVGWKARKWREQAQSSGDRRYWDLSAQEQHEYNVGQGILPSRVFAKFRNLLPEQRGRTLEADYSKGKLFLYRIGGAVESVINVFRPGRFDFFDWTSTGMTPEINLAFGTNGWSTIAMIASMMQLSEDVIDID